MVPVLVFVSRREIDRFFERSSMGPYKWPIGVSYASGSVDSADSAKVGSDYGLLLLDDDDAGSLASYRGRGFPNIASKVPVIVVAHGGDTEYSDPVGALERDWRLSGHVCESFSHVEGDKVYDEILAILRGGGASQVQAFVDGLRNVDRLAALDKLAMICQLGLLGGDCGLFEDEEKSQLRALGKPFAASYQQAKAVKQWRGAHDEVVRYATQIAR